MRNTPYWAQVETTDLRSGVPPVTAMAWRHQYDEEADAEERARTDINQEGQISLTQQQYKDDVDLNVMVKRFGVTDGAIPQPAYDPRAYGDFTDAVDFREALDRTRAAQQQFQQLPAELRSRFGNDPVELFAWVSNKENAEEAVKLGLLAKKERAAAAPAPEKTP